MSLIRGDAIAIPLRDESVDLIVTSPPYFALRSYTDGGEHYDGQIGSEPTPQDFLEALWAVTAECRRVLKPSGSMWVNLGDKYVADNRGSGADGKRGDAKHAPAGPLGYPTAGMRQKSLMGLPWRYAIGCIDQLDLILRAEVIWSKPNGLPESVTDRVRRSHEQWFHFTKEPRYFAAVDEVREPQTGTSHYGRKDGGAPPEGRLAKMVGTGERGGVLGSTNPDMFNPLGKLPGSVWTIPSEPLKVPDWLGVDHFAAFPQEWPRRIILGWSPRAVCSDCGFLLGSSYDNGLHGVRQSDHRRPHQGRVREAQGAQTEPVLRESVRREVQRQEPEVDEVPPLDDTGIRRGLDAGSPDGAEERLPDGTPPSDGGTSRQDAGSDGGRAPHQRGQDGQPHREPRTDGKGRPRQEAQAAPQAFSVPSLRRTDSDVRDAQSCPNCGCSELRPSVIADPFGGTGTVSMVARALGRYPVHIDLSADYLRLARWRIYESGHASKTAERTNRERQGVLL